MLRLLSIGALVCAIGFGIAACSDALYDPAVPDDPREVMEIKVRAGISDDDFCRHIDIENIHRTIPVVNRYIDNLPGGLNPNQRALALVALFHSFEGVTWARLFHDEYMRTPAVFFSFMDGGTERELALDFSSTGKVLSYHYDVTTGVYAKVKQGVAIDKVFDMINSLDLEVDDIKYGVLVSSRPSSEAELQRILDALNAKPYTNDGEAWRTGGYLHYQTGAITISPHLFGMHRQEYQADWLAAMTEYGLTDSPNNGIGYAVDFLVPEDDTILESHWKGMFQNFDILELIDLYYKRYTLADETIEGEGYEKDVTAIDSKIYIDLIEDYKTSPRSFSLQCRTEQVYSHTGYSLVTVDRRSADGIDISFKGVLPLGMGFTMPSPATAVIDLGSLDEGTYTLNLRNGDVKQTGRLVVSAESYTIEMADNPTFGFTDKQINRIPENTIWGYVHYQRDEFTPTANALVDDLVGIGAERRPYLPGYYREFEIDRNGDPVQPAPDPEHRFFGMNFVLHYAGNPAKVDELLGRYARRYKDEPGVSMVIYTDRGEEFLSWMYDRE